MKDPNKQDSYPTIEEALGIELSINGNGYYAVATALGESAPYGMGKSMTEAKYDLLAQLLWSRVLGPDHLASTVSILRDALKR